MAFRECGPTAVVKPNYFRRSVDLALQTWSGALIQWGTVSEVQVDEAAEPPPECWLSLDEEAARAVYGALADHFGHSGHDTRALRRDYDSERNRVDRMINHLIGGR